MENDILCDNLALSDFQFDWTTSEYTYSANAL